jgi:DNA polymerase III subunit gamma/tau
MSYLVLARKYRPQTFSQVVGQEHVTRTLGNAFSQDRVHHAFLFCGPRGVGKTTAARILAKALSCETGPTAEPCGTCSACTSITQGTAVDVLEMDGASNRGIDAIRELTEAVRYQPAILRKKVYVIDEVHMLTTEAFNALLKTLEEPPPHVTFVLATTEPHKLPNTILSRCQRYDFKLVPLPRLAEHLQAIATAEELTFEPGALSLIAREAGGSVRDALSLADQVISYVGEGAIAEATVAEVLGVADRALTRSLVQALAAGDAGAALEAVSAAADRGVDEVQVARAIVRYLRDLAVLQVATSRQLVDGSADEIEALAAEAKGLEPARIRQMFDRMNRACEDLGRTQQPRLVLDLALIEVAALEPLVPLGDLIDRLGDLERRLGGGGRGGGSPPGPAGGGRGGAQRSGPRVGMSAASDAGSERMVGARMAAADAAAPAMPADVLERREASPAPAQAAASPTRSHVPPSPAPAREQAPVTNPPPAAVASGRAASSPLMAAPEGERPSAQAIREWDEITAGLLAAGKFALSAQFQEARLLRFGGGAVEVGFPPGEQLGFDIASDPDNVKAMKAFLQDRYGSPVEFRVRALSAEEAERARSLVEIDRERARDERSRREAEARAHPLTRMVLDTFGATIEEIKPLG